MFRPIAQGGRGPAVEDVQKRLLTLGFDLGPTGVDGVFWGATLAAVRLFQQERGLREDGVVGDETWAALVDATFQLGDRLLYLKLPYLHGADVETLQGALNVLGFACGEPDGIFGAYTERAVGEFQANVGLRVDGITGPDTVRAIERLRHVWRGKDPSSPAALALATARVAEVLRNAEVTLVCADACGRVVAERVANLALATDADAHLRVCREPATPDGTVFHLVSDAPGAWRDGIPAIRIGPDAPAQGRFIAAFQAASPVSEAIVILPAGVCDDEHDAQSVAVHLLDGICAVLSSKDAVVIP
ncbi:MAG: peptidoglycan-binding domain-containing protein [Coriobacteriia bacterium]